MPIVIWLRPLAKQEKRRKKQNEEKEDLDICSQKFDTMAVIRSELFVFLGMQMWRFSHRGVLRFL